MTNPKITNFSVDYLEFKGLRDDYRNNRQNRIPKPIKSLVIGPGDEVLYEHTALREPRDLLWIPEAVQAPGVIDQYRRKAMSPVSLVRFVLTIEDNLRDLPVSLCAGIDREVEVERRAESCGTVEFFELTSIPTGSRYWVGLRIDGQIPQERRRDIRALILAVGSESRKSGKG